MNESKVNEKLTRLKINKKLSSLQLMYADCQELSGHLERNAKVWGQDFSPIFSQGLTSLLGTNILCVPHISDPVGPGQQG